MEKPADEMRSTDKSFRIFFRVTITLWMLLALSFRTSVVCGQTVQGQINGTVTDASGGVVPGAEIILKSLDTGTERSTTSAASGVYFLSSVSPGHYSLKVSAKGFKSYVVPNLTLLVNQAQTVNAQLVVGAVTQTVEVQAGGVTLNTTGATIGTVIGQRDVVTMPLNGRNFTELIMLTPGAAPIQGPQQNAFIITGGISPAVNGMQAQMNNFTLDGVENNQRFSNSYSVSPPPDAIAEFKVASHETGADVSLAAGANVNLVTRSGDNTFHGSVWEFLRNNDLDANNYFNNFFGEPNLPYRQNQFGYYLGGPVYIPHLINGRRTKTYFSTYYEGFRSRETSTTNATVPDAAEAGGNFSDLLGSVIGTDCLGRPIQQNELYDPTTTVANTNCPGGFVRNPFPNNTIPKIQPVAAAYLKYYYPSPNRSGTPNLALPQTTTNTANQYGFRIDHSISDSQQLFGRASFYNWVEVEPGALPANPLQQQNHGVNVALSYTKIFSPTLLVDLLAGYNRSGIPYYEPGIGGATGAAFDQAVGPTFYNKFSVGGNTPLSLELSGSRFNSAGFVSYELANPDYSYQYNGDVKKVAGRHEMSFGFRYMHYRHVTDPQGAAYHYYSPQTTDQPGIPQTGEALASFMIGYPDETSRNILGYWNNWGNIYNAYFGDTWKVTSRFTINLGLQYVYAPPPLVLHNTISLFDWQIAQTQPDATDFTFAYLWCTTNPITGAPPNCPRNSIMEPDKRDFAPRVGIAYSPWNDTVIRAGFGTFYDFNQNIEQNSIRVAQGSWPYAVSETIAGQNLTTLGPLNPPLSVDNLFPSQQAGPPLPYESINRHNRSPYATEFNLGFERMLPFDMKLSADYVGSVGRRLILAFTQNIAALGPGSIASRRPLKNVGTFPWETNDGPSSYNALQVKLEKALSSGLAFLNSYTWSKSFDEQSGAESGFGPPGYTYQPSLSWGPSDFDLRQINATSLIYELPFGRGRTFASNAGRALDLLIGGWQTSGIVRVQSGSEFSILAGQDVANLGTDTGQTASRISAAFPSGTKNRATWFNPGAFQLPAFGTLGNTRRNFLTGPSYADIDAGLMKNFTIRESLHLQFRAEFFNALNHTNFETPTNSMASPDFGQILAAYPPREIQGALKLIW